MASTSPYQPTLPYSNSKSIESQLPRVPVPPLEHDYTSGKPMIDLKTMQNDMVLYQDDKYGDAAFLQRLAATKPVNLDVQLLDWHFDMRRQAQAIIPFLYLGPSSCMRDTAFLDGAGITFLLAVRSSKVVQGRSNYLNPATSPAAINRQTATFDIETPYDFMTGIKPTTKALVDYLQANTTISSDSTVDIQARVLVCCETGNDRSATFVAAFLMVIYGFSAAEAMQVLHSQRISVAIDENMRRMLLGFGDILTAERQVTSAQLAAQELPSSLQTAQASQNKKRNHSTVDMDDDDDDEKMDESEDSFDGEEERSGVAPFMDTSG